MIGIIALAVIGVTVVSVLGQSQLANAQFAWQDPFEYYLMVDAANDVVPPGIAEELQAEPDVERALAYHRNNIRVPSLLGSLHAPVLGLDEREFSWFMSRTGLRVAKGRLPAEGKPEIALHASIVRSRHLEIGDLVGLEVDDQEYLRGAWTVVGVIDGPIQVGLAPRSVMRAVSPVKDIPGEVGFLVFPKPGRMDAVDAFARALPRNEVIVTTLATMTRFFSREYDSAKMVIWLIDVVTIAALALATGLLNTIYFLQRLPEYGILAALGYRNRFLIRRSLTEALALTVAGWLGGLMLAQTLVWVLNAMLFAPRGYELQSLDREALSFTLPIPVLVTVFSLFTVVRQLRRLDPVTIIERRA